MSVRPIMGVYFKAKKTGNLVISWEQRTNRWRLKYTYWRSKLTFGLLKNIFSYSDVWSLMLKFVEKNLMGKGKWKDLCMWKMVVLKLLVSNGHGCFTVWHKQGCYAYDNILYIFDLHEKKVITMSVPSDHLAAWLSVAKTWNVFFLFSDMVSEIFQFPHWQPVRLHTFTPFSMTITTKLQMVTGVLER